ncbi:MAG TPA: glutamate synthase central domain-containing protein, partial [Candidatus Limnocylindrales bacterium]
EHDACGVGFVADSTGTQRSRVLPLALAGLAALGHRGAFAADGESSDGAGVLLPLSPGVLERIGAPRRRGDRPGSLGVLTLFLPPGPRAPRGRRLVADVLAAEGLALRGWRGVPVDPAALGPEARSARPEIAHAFVDRPSGLRAGEFGRALVLARRRIEAAARSARLPGLAVASASAETIVYKALVRGDRLADFYPDLAGSLDVRFAVFHQRYATNTHPVWRLAQPFGRIAHNGEINTVRANREELRGRSADLGRSELARRLTALGPLTSPDGSDSLSLDEALELLVASGWRLDTALAAIVPEAPALGSGTLDRPGAGGPLAPWDGPAALVFADGRRVGALLDRNGLRPAAFSVTSDGLVALASEAGAVPLAAAETVRRGRLGPGELLLVDLARRQVLENAEAKRAVAAASPRTVAPLPHSGTIHDRFHVATDPPKTAAPIRYLAGLDAERFRLDIRTMVLEGHEPLWSMGDDTPTAASARVDRRVADHLRQSFAQVTNPPIDPERERVVMDLTVDLGRRPPLLGRRTAAPATMRLARPIVADLPGVLDAFEAAGRRTVILDATWPAEDGPVGLERALDRLGRGALAAPSAHLVVLSDRRFALDRLPVPSVLAAGAVNTALTAGGRRGRTDILVEAADVLDPHALAMTLAAGARAVSPWLALELARELAGTRGAEELGPEDAAARLVGAFETALRKTLARMGISCLASYVGGQLFEVVELDPSVLRRCFPSAPSWPGRVRFADLAARQLRRLAAARELGHPLEPQRMPDPGLVRFRADGETHLYAPSIVREIQALAAGPWDDAAASAPIEVHAALERYRSAIGRAPAVVRDQLVLRPSRPPLPLEDVEPVQAIAPRFVASAMSLGALSPEAHQAVTLGMQLFGGAANTGEG